MDMDKLAKVLALADSSSEGEALNAVRAARQMLAKAGMSFQDIAHAARGRSSIGTRWDVDPAPVSASVAAALQRQVNGLKVDLGLVQVRLNERTEEATRWQQRAEELQGLIESFETKAERRRQRVVQTLGELRVLRELLDRYMKSPDAPLRDTAGGHHPAAPEHAD